MVAKILTTEFSMAGGSLAACGAERAGNVPPIASTHSPRNDIREKRRVVFIPFPICRLPLFAVYRESEQHVARLTLIGGPGIHIYDAVHDDRAARPQRAPGGIDLI